MAETPQNTKEEISHSPAKMQRWDFRRELREMAKRCYSNLYWDPEEDIALLCAKYNLDPDVIKRKVKEALTI